MKEVTKKPIAVNTERIGDMVAEKLGKSAAKEQVKQRVRDVCSRLDFTEDWFFRLLMRQGDACQALLRLVFDPDITVCDEIKTNAELSQPYERSVKLDVLCEDKDHRHINIEMQRSDNVDHLLRVAFHLAMLQVKHTPTGDGTFGNVARVAVVYVTEFDLFHKKDGIYQVCPMLCKYNTPVDMGQQAVFVNLKAPDDAKIQALRRLLKEQEISDEVVNDENLSAIANSMKDLTTTKKGEETMSAALTELCNLFKDEGKDEGKAEGRAEGISLGETRGETNMLRNAMTLHDWTPTQTFEFFGIPECDRAKYVL